MTRSRCIGTTNRGTRCKRPAMRAFHVCRYHLDAEPRPVGPPRPPPAVPADPPDVALFMAMSDEIDARTWAEMTKPVPWSAPLVDDEREWSNPRPNRAVLRDESASVELLPVGFSLTTWNRERQARVDAEEARRTMDALALVYLAEQINAALRPVMEDSE